MSFRQKRGGYIIKQRAWSYEIDSVIKREKIINESKDYTVYLGNEPGGGKLIIKETKPKNHKELFNEFNLLFNLNHPGIIKVLDFYFYPDYKSVLLLEYLKGGDLSKRMKKRGELDLVKFSKDLFDILLYLEKNNVVHSDLKPENILFSDKKSQHPILSDFGLAKFKTNGKPRGTLLYAAPEVMNGKENTHKSDIFSAGVIIYELITGNRIKNYNEYKKLFIEGKWENNIKESLFKNLLKMALNPEPERRGSASEIMQNIFKERRIYFNEMEFIEKEREKIKNNLKNKILKIKKGGMFYIIKGKEGAGKSFLLKKIYCESKEKMNTLLIDKGRIPYLTIPEKNLYPFLLAHLLNLRANLPFAVFITDPPFENKDFLNFIKSLKETSELKDLSILIESTDKKFKGEKIELKEIDEERLLTYIEENTAEFEKEEIIRTFIKSNKRNLKKILPILKTIGDINELKKETIKKAKLKGDEKEVISTLNFFGKLNVSDAEEIFGPEIFEKLTKENLVERVYDYFTPLLYIKQKLPYKKIYKRLKDKEIRSIEGKMLYSLSAINLNDYSCLKLIEDDIEKIKEQKESYLITFFENLPENLNIELIPFKILKHYFNFLIFRNEKQKIKKILNHFKRIDEKKYRILYSIELYYKGDFQKSYEIIKDLKEEEILLWKGLCLINTGEVNELKKVIRNYKKSFSKTSNNLNLALFHKIEASYYEMKGDIKNAEISYKKSLFHSKKYGESYTSFLNLMYYLEFLYYSGNKGRIFRYVNKIDDFYRRARTYPLALLFLEFLRFEFYREEKNINFLENIKKRIDIIYQSFKIPYFEPYILGIEAKLKILKKEDPSDLFEKAIKLSQKYNLYPKLLELLNEYLKYLRIKDDIEKFNDILNFLESSIKEINPFNLKITAYKKALLFLTLNREIKKVEKRVKELIDLYKKVNNYEREKILFQILYLLNIEKDKKIKKEIEKSIKNNPYPSLYADIFEKLIKSFEYLLDEKFVDAITEFDRFTSRAKELIKDSKFIKDLLIFINTSLSIKNQKILIESGIIPKIDAFINYISEKIEDEFLKNEFNNIKKEIIRISSSVGGIKAKEKWDIFRSYLIYASKYNKEDEFLRSTIEMMVKATGTERGMIVIKREDKEDLFEIKGTYGLYKKKVGKDLIDISMSSLKDATKKGAQFFIPDALQSPEFKKRESIRKFRIRSILCFPLFYEDKPFGAIYLDSRKRKDFTEEDFELVRIMAEIFTISYQRNKLIDKIEKEKEKIEEERRNIEEKLKEMEKIGKIVGTRDFISKITNLINKVKNLEKPIPILIVGETGTGKTLLADTIHNSSIRKKGPIVFFSFNEFPETLAESELFGYKKGAFTGAFEDKIGLIEQANNGTLVLENIESIPPSLQDKILRFLDTGKFRPLGSSKEKEVDVMIIATALPDIEEKVKRGELRQDLYYRLKGIYFYIPPLRERKDDIPVLITYFIKDIKNRLKIKEKIRIKHETWKYLYEYPWPGNVRELKFAFESAVLNAKEGELIGPEHFPEEIRKVKVKEEKKFVSLRDMEKNYIIEVLKATNWNKTKAAEILKISRQALLQKLKDFGIF